MRAILSRGVLKVSNKDEVKRTLRHSHGVALLKYVIYDVAKNIFCFVRYGIHTYFTKMYKSICVGRQISSSYENEKSFFKRMIRY